VGTGCTLGDASGACVACRGLGKAMSAGILVLVIVRVSSRSRPSGAARNVRGPAYARPEGVAGYAKRVDRLRGSGPALPRALHAMAAPVVPPYLHSHY